MLLAKIRVVKPKVIFVAVLLLFALPYFSTAMSVSMSVTDSSSVVKPDDRVYFSADIKYPENKARKDLRLKYEIEQGGEVIANSTTLKAIETQMQFLDFIIVPSVAKSGLATLKVTVSDYADLNNTFSASFNVTKGDGQMKMYVFIIGAFILMMMLVVSITVFIVNNRMKKMMQKR